MTAESEKLAVPVSPIECSVACAEQQWSAIRATVCADTGTKQLAARELGAHRPLVGAAHRDMCVPPLTS